MNRGILVIGSNCGEREKHITEALSLLSEVCIIEKASSVYESPDCLGSGLQYLNLVAAISSCMEEEDFNLTLKVIEDKCGRVKKQGSREVAIDIDIVVWGGVVRRNADFNAQYFKRGYREIF